MDKQNTGLRKGSCGISVKSKSKSLALFSESNGTEKKPVKCCFEKEINEIDEIIKTNTDCGFPEIYEREQGFNEFIDSNGSNL